MSKPAKRSFLKQQLWKVNLAQSSAEQVENTLDVEVVKKLLRLTADTQDEENLYQYASIYPAWNVGLAVQVDEKYQYNGNLYKVVQAHTTQLDWTPDIVPALFTIYSPPGTIPDWVQPTGSQDAYNIGDQVMFEGHVYESLINANVWSPTAYPAGWLLIS